MIQKLLTHRKYLFVVFGLLCLFSIFGLTRLRINFEFEQFFPDGDEDLSFFKSFTSEFENDDNFLFTPLKTRPQYLIPPICKNCISSPSK